MPFSRAICWMVFSPFNASAGDASFELGLEVSSLSFHGSDFGVIRPTQTSQSFNRPPTPFPETTSVLPGEWPLR